MVRVKKRYFVLRLERQRDVEDAANKKRKRVTRYQR